ncbi:MAG: hypothetical protein O3B13_11825 [Planctomycetota bacterium]|nr:hypothetical protein [Planctomycetota bacterium]
MSQGLKLLRGIGWIVILVTSSMSLIAADRPVALLVSIDDLRAELGCYGNAEISDFYDGAQTDLALQTLSRLKDRDKRLILTPGYYRPHFPFVAPKRYREVKQPGDSNQKLAAKAEKMTDRP